ncbi:glutathione-dependent formaldehyde dehydrogenase [Plasmopara halstedii]|uniref:Glutathione-dependent formaldehyde dehydrogenase n=1 Tax=Plasmopara halstedii TaxID=4781 RepID=A0A0P1B119_PLAHL|nr:glutathione-dependent formaldehyde dehydrogenase [Plasmopara halstedii]CEG47849.1 glutathione-dependent formaldehyde dehydrogenase [Plasmopara halstedii]|eukprot:XP_024584218.1 glutathione-dependent formaldehyde dehydrogenase [Plasmopara halstedii]
MMSTAHTHGHEACSKDPAGCMRAVVWTGNAVKLAHVAKPRIIEASDVVVKVTACSVSPDFATDICAGVVKGLENNQILGSEAVGIVESVGAEVNKVKVGDRVAVSFVLACGNCKHCRRHEYAACNCTNASQEFKQTYGGWAPAAVLGSTRMLGNVPGVQAEYVRVPFGDVNCFKLPAGVSDDKAVLGVETTVTALHAVDTAGIKEGDCVVIWGLGPIGLQAAHWCKLRGAKSVLGIELCAERVKFAQDHMNLHVINRLDLSSAQVVAKLQQMLPPGGADAVIDTSSCSTSSGWMATLEKTIGMENQPEPADTFKEMLMIVRKCGHLSIVSDYMCSVRSFPIGHIAMKSVTVHAGRTPAQKYYPQVFDAIESGELDPSVLISHRIALEELPGAYSGISKKDGGYLKVFIAPHEMRSKV